MNSILDRWIKIRTSDEHQGCITKPWIYLEDELGKWIIICCFFTNKKMINTNWSVSRELAIQRERERVNLILHIILPGIAIQIVSLVLHILCILYLAKIQFDLKKLLKEVCLVNHTQFRYIQLVVIDRDLSIRQVNCIFISFIYSMHSNINFTKIQMLHIG